MRHFLSEERGQAGSAGVFALLYQAVEWKGVGERSQSEVEIWWVLEANAADFACRCWQGTLRASLLQRREVRFTAYAEQVAGDAGAT